MYCSALCRYTVQFLCLCRMAPRRCCAARAGECVFSKGICDRRGQSWRRSIDPEREKSRPRVTNQTLVSKNNNKKTWNHRITLIALDKTSCMEWEQPARHQQMAVCFWPWLKLFRIGGSWWIDVAIHKIRATETKRNNQSWLRMDGCHLMANFQHLLGIQMP